ncbi:MAG: hypothetical protein JWM87_1099 [Candidatus Eremiobacteraeota bacterium]|nr:hypothetical protein [Candidatus Eremiobacteraeota bacterium]
MTVQVAFLTGQSDPPSCALAADQHAFLDALPAAEHEKVRCNFPYDRAGDGVLEVALWRASLNNIKQYAASRSGAFARAHRPPVLEMLSKADRTLLLAGSCGIELLNNLHLPAGVLRSVFVLGYGPVARCRPACAHEIAGSRRDWISRLWFPSPDAWADAGHRGYLAGEHVRSRCAELLERLRSEA